METGCHGNFWVSLVLSIDRDGFLWRGQLEDISDDDDLRAVFVASARGRRAAMERMSSI